MACFARGGCVFGGIGTFTTCGCGVDLCNMNSNCCHSCSNRCNQQTRCERTCGNDDARNCDNERGQTGCDRCD